MLSQEYVVAIVYSVNQVFTGYFSVHSSNFGDKSRTAVVQFADLFHLL